MPPIAQNPNLKALVNFNGPAYEVIHNSMAQVLNITLKQASEQLEAAYNVKKEIRIQAWNNQIWQEQEAEDLRQLQAWEQEEQRLKEERKAAEAERKEIKRKKPKINDFDEDCTSNDHIVSRPSPFALNKLKNFEYIDLYYFMSEGCAATGEESKVMVLMCLSGQPNLLMWQSMVFLPVIICLQVRSLSLITFLQALKDKAGFRARTPLLLVMPKDSLAITLFFFKLDDHPMWDCPYGDEIIIAFQAKIWQEWHDALDQNNSFNISKINSDTLQEVADVFYDNLQAKG